MHHERSKPRRVESPTRTRQENAVKEMEKAPTTESTSSSEEDDSKTEALITRAQPSKSSATENLTVDLYEITKRIDTHLEEGIKAGVLLLRLVQIYQTQGLMQIRWD